MKWRRKRMDKITVIGAGLAGCEAAWKLAESGFQVELCEMKPKKFTPAQKSENFAELVCSNSLKAARLDSAAGLLKEEMRRLGSITMEAAEKTAVAAGGALAVDRELFSAYITEKICAHKNISITEGEVTEIPKNGTVIFATGPLTSDSLAETLRERFGGTLSFYDAVAPIVAADSIDWDRVFLGARYEHGDPDYVNCPMERDEYDAFYEALVSAEKAPLHDFDENPNVYEGCMPVEIMASRGHDTLRFGPLRPVGLTDPKTGRRPWANIQLRRENAAGTMYNLVGFQTNLKFGEQKRVFSMIPGLEHAEFLRYGVMHRDTFMDSPRLLSKSLALKDEPRLFFAGQFTGVEGYTESAATGILAGINAARFVSGKAPLVLPVCTMLGALVNYITDESVKNFQPMGANMGVLPPLEKNIRKKDDRYAALAERALTALEETL
jgi:methylenetetrahydrofolate--tRNA-(uracil-5-)-methyltransferase